MHARGGQKTSFVMNPGAIECAPHGSRVFTWFVALELDEHRG